ncbi:tRNA pseudouridine synthase B [Allomyces macrogynus ATCC 38327]|uniref:tRNA pseudouridine(55) synthase n=1 Tax=Allomyces macrogynus (strain ATCC 38327) TaxID=578462 RepID=A0A0L0T570_ALLM3|nr:tRNA pseudouridine synthase B [Allomyces macrogynus ATCC 38327]|eukprot:KNE69684.1 tRNA pseudouridine synthase B [Allomyces macrogynus ATCC 38327]
MPDRQLMNVSDKYPANCCIFSRQCSVFAVDKPQGKTSAHVVNILKAILCRAMCEEEGLRRTQLKVGHGGTLDPMATGVLIIGVGHGTKALASYLNCTKTYTVTGQLGAETNTYDMEGQVTKTAALRSHHARPD